MQYINSTNGKVPTATNKENYIGRMLQQIGIADWQNGLNESNWYYRIEPFWKARYGFFDLSMNAYHANNQMNAYQCRFYDNMFWSNNYNINKGGSVANERGSVSISDLSIFEDPENLNFKFKNPSNYGPKIPFENIGLYIDEYRCAVPNKDDYRRAIKQHFEHLACHTGDSYDPETINNRLYYNTGKVVMGTVPCEDVYTQTEFFFDLGTTTSAVYPNFERLSNKTVPGLYGWIDTSELKTKDNGTASKVNDLNRDMVYSSKPGIFELTVPRGTYKVLITFGDAYTVHDKMMVKMQGEVVFSDINTTLGNTFFNKIYYPVVNDGKLSIEFSDEGGEDQNWAATRIIITKESDNTTSEEYATSCDYYEWNGTTYTESGDYEFQSPNDIGGTNTATLHLVIKNSTTSETSVTACDLFNWNGTDYTTSGDYEFTTTNVAGCDSTAILHLTINTTPAAIAEPASQVVCSETSFGIMFSSDVEQTSYSWTRDQSDVISGMEISGTGDVSGSLVNNSLDPVEVTFTITPAALGCEGSPIIAKVTVNPLTKATVDPFDQVVYALNQAEFQVEAIGTPPFTYQWQESADGGSQFADLMDGDEYTGTSGSILTLPMVSILKNGFQYRCVISGTCSSETSSAAVLTVNKRPTELVYTGDLSEQMTDEQLFLARLEDKLSGGLLAEKTILFELGNQTISGSTALNGEVEASLFIAQKSGNYTVATSFSGDDTYLSSEQSDAFVILKEDAIVDYTGPEFVSVPCESCATTVVTLMASVRDIAMVHPEVDMTTGEITEARVKFVNLDNNTDISGWLTPGLVNPLDVTAGVVNFDWTVSIPNDGYDVYSIGVVVDGDGEYIGSDETVLNISRSTLDEFITGGGNIVPENSNGIYASETGTKVNFGFNVKYNNSGSKLKGKMSIIFRNGDRIYQIKSTAVSSLSVNSANPDAQEATFTSKANLLDITDPDTPVSVYGGLSLQVTLTDKGEPGTEDMIGISLFDGNTLVYSSNWLYTETQKLKLQGGNLVVHSGSSSTKSATIQGAGTDQPAVNAELVLVEVYPNPTKGICTINIENFQLGDALIKITDIAGKSVLSKVVNVISPNQTEKINLGDYSPGVYLVSVIQGDLLFNTKIVRE